MLKRFSVILFLLGICGIANAQTAQPTPPATVEQDSRSQGVTAQSIETAVQKASIRWEENFDARLKSLEMNKSMLDLGIRIAGWIGVVAVGFTAAFSIYGIKSVRDLQAQVKEQANVAVDLAFREKSGVAAGYLSDLMKTVDDFHKTRDEIAKAQSEIDKITARLARYAAFSDSLEKTRFDPLTEYYSLREEVRQRREAWIKRERGDKSITLETTIAHPEFRQRAAVIFGRLLEEAQEDAAKGKSRLSVVDLFNISAVASEANLNFASLEFMEIAATQDKAQSPEITARMIRQRITASRITRDEARTQISKVLQDVGSFDLIHVVSESFNIGMHLSDMKGMAELIDKNLKPELRNISYPLLVRAELLFMSDKTEDLTLADQLVTQGLAALGKEGAEARWREGSINQLMKMVREQGKRSPAPAWLDDAMKVLQRELGY